MQNVTNSLFQQVDPSLRQALLDLDTIPIEFSRANISNIREASRQRIEAQQPYGSIKPKKISVDNGGQQIDLFVYERPGAASPAPCLIWFHGGGYVMGAAQDNWFPPLFAQRLGCTVVSVDYRLAPEHPAPAAIRDGWFVLNWLGRQTEKLGLDPMRMAVGGLSAGGGLAAAVSLYARDNGGVQPSFQLLLCPMLDHTHDTPSGRMNGHPIWNRQDSLAAWNMYLGDNPEPDVLQYASPSRMSDLAGLPATYIAVGEVDLFLDENKDFAERLRGAGTACEFASYPGVFHGGEVMGFGQPIANKMTDAHVKALGSALGLFDCNAKAFDEVS